MTASASPLVSICIPSYNGASLIEETILSALQQTYSNFEIVITDDCSADATVEIAQRLAVQHNNIAVYVNTANKGLIGNWQECISKSNGEWIKFLFQDDLMQPDCIEKMITACLNNNSKLAMCARKFIVDAAAPDNFKNFFLHKIIKPEYLFKQSKYYNPQQLATVLAPHLMQNVLGEPTTWLMHKTIFNQAAPFNNRMRQLMDYEYILCCVMQFGMVFLKEELVSFRVHNNSESSRNVNDTTVTADEKFISRLIQSHTGDYMEIFGAIIKNPALKILQCQWKPQRLQIFFTKLYFKSISKYGVAQTSKALQQTLKNTPFKIRPYSFVSYLINKVQYLIWVKPILRKKITM